MNEKLIDEVRTLLIKGMTVNDIALEIDVSRCIVWRAVHIINRRRKNGKNQLYEMRSDCNEA